MGTLYGQESPQTGGLTIANEQNLIHLTSERAREIGMINAGAPKPHNSWLRQKWCNKNCLFKDRCPAISTSQATGKIKGKYPCFIKKQPQEVQNYFWSLFSCGEEGLIKVIMDLHFRLMLKTQSAKITAKELREALTASLDMKKGIYGDKDTGDQTIINIIVSNQVDV